MKRCPESFRGDRCERRDGHDGLHISGSHTWAFRAPTDARWINLARTNALPAKELAR